MTPLPLLPDFEGLASNDVDFSSPKNQHLSSLLQTLSYNIFYGGNYLHWEYRMSLLSIDSLEFNKSVRIIVYLRDDN